MNTRTFGRTGWQVSEIGFGAWGIGGGQWGGADEAESMAALHKALDCGINFFDTADVYGDGLSERLIARLRRERSEPLYVATKAGRRLNPHTADGYNAANLTAFIDRSLKNLATDRIDLVQLHCPPTEVYYRPEVFQALDGLVTAGKIRHYGVSVERVEEALKAIEYPNVQSVQIIFNAFRLRPAELFFEVAMRRRVAVIARVPRANITLSGPALLGHCARAKSASSPKPASSRAEIASPSAKSCESDARGRPLRTFTCVAAIVIRPRRARSAQFFP
jgi:aryl-alcohol dehydrogenase-like predicted oxidoreductase